jgi:orotate phosphoribosyltransferase
MSQNVDPKTQLIPDLAQNSSVVRFSTEDWEMKRRELIRCVRARSYREGDFTLASGAKSKFYVDLKGTTLHPEGASLIAELGARALMESGLKIDAVGGLTLGADPIATAVSLGAWREGVTWPAFIVRKATKGHGTQKWIEGLEAIPRGGSVALVEDVMTTGGSAWEALERVQEAGLHPVCVLTIVDRQSGGPERFRAQGLKVLSLTTLSEVQLFRN